MSAYQIGNLFCALDLELMVHIGYLGPLNGNGERELYEETRPEADNYEPASFQPDGLDPRDPGSFDPEDTDSSDLGNHSSSDPGHPDSSDPGCPDRSDPGNSCSSDPGVFDSSDPRHPDSSDPGYPDSSDPGHPDSCSDPGHTDSSDPGSFVPRVFVRPLLTARRVWYPENFISRQTLVTLGFTDAKADELWRDWPGAHEAGQLWNFDAPADSVFYARALQREFLALMMGVMDEARLSTPPAAVCLSGGPGRTADPRRELMITWGLGWPTQNEILCLLKSVVADRDVCARCAKEYIATRFFSLSRVWDDSLAREVALFGAIAKDAPREESELPDLWEDLQEVAKRIRFGDLQISCSMLPPPVVSPTRTWPGKISV